MAGRPAQARRTKRRTGQLGMPLGTAANQLRKRVMFHLAARLGENVCLRCGAVIETADDLSLDHIQPWLDADPALFWDLDNLAFSHLRCNTAAGRHSRQPTGLEPPNKIDRPDGLSWCSRCQSLRPEDEFHRDKTGPKGRTRWCKPCRSRRHP